MKRKLLAVFSVLIVSLIVHSVSIVWKDEVYGVQRSEPHDTLTLEVVCVHGDHWGIRFDIGYMEWLHHVIHGRFGKAWRHL